MANLKVQPTTVAKTGAAAATPSLTTTGKALAQAATQAAGVPLGAERAAKFASTILPALAADAAPRIGVDAATLTALLKPAIDGSASADATLGLRTKNGALEADPNYPPRAANALWPDVAKAAGFSAGDIAAVTKLNEQIGALPVPEGSYAPLASSMTPELQQLANRVAASLTGASVSPPLSSTERAFVASLTLNNLTWHMTNWQRAAGDASRADPLARNNVFNTYSDNLAYASARGGTAAVIDMAISDAYNAGKPNVGRAALSRPAPATSVFASGAAHTAATARRLDGQLDPAKMAPHKPFTLGD